MKAFLVAALLVLAVHAVDARRGHHKTRHHELEEKKYDFNMYIAEYEKVYTADELEMRRAIFENQLLKVLEHNRNPAHTWKMGINHLSDRTESELKAIRGHRPHLNAHPDVVERRAELHVPHLHAAASSSLPTSVDWRTKGAITPVKDQGQCGSCWTFASSETIESFYYLQTGTMVELSEQQIASCTSNPLDCGGTGGCEGGTAEVAFQGVMDAGGIASEWTYPYSSWFGHDSQCLINGTAGFQFQPVVKLAGYTKLPVNDQNALLNAVANLGPIAISVDAGAWSAYEKGVFSGCNMNSPDIDHAVQLVGYGTDPQFGDYWLVRNSWTPFWGESGFIRIARPATAPCGVDTTPGDGTACKPYPANISVCGMCGILSDSAYPIIKA